MLKRFQVILPDWLEEYINWGVEKYDLNFSELIRLEICLSIIALVQGLNPEYKSKITIGDVAMSIDSFEKDKLPGDETFRMISKINFEARKALDYRKEMLAKKQSSLTDEKQIFFIAVEER